MTKVMRRGVVVRIGVAPGNQALSSESATVGRVSVPHPVNGGLEEVYWRQTGWLIGEKAQGFLSHTLPDGDVANGCLEGVPVWGQGQVRVRSTLHYVHYGVKRRIAAID